MFDNPLVRKWLPPALAILGVSLFVVAWLAAGDNDDPSLDSAVEQLIPGEGDQVLVQNPIGIDLVDGEPYEFRFTVNGTEIPIREFTVSEALNRATYQPGDDQTLESLEPGENCVVAEYWLVREGPESARSTRWCFTAI